MTKVSKKHRAPSPIGALLLMAAEAILVFVGITLAFSVLSYLLKDPASAVSVLSLPAFFVSAVITSLLLRRRGQGLLLSVLSVLVFLFLLLLGGVLLAHGALCWKLLLYDVTYLLTFLAIHALPAPKRGRSKHRFRD